MDGEMTRRKMTDDNKTTRRKDNKAGCWDKDTTHTASLLCLALFFGVYCCLTMSHNVEITIIRGLLTVTREDYDRPDQQWMGRDDNVWCRRRRRRPVDSSRLGLR